MIFPHNWGDRLLIKVLERSPIYEDSSGLIHCSWCRALLVPGEHEEGCLIVEIKDYLDAQPWMKGPLP